MTICNPPVIIIQIFRIIISLTACKNPSSKVGDQQAVKLKVGDIPLTLDPGSKERCVPIPLCSL